ncbi:FAD-dependent monooxygenase [Jiella sonneratiae]|uniref:FAD-dependent monooxygenase n=1 Tax=Jiella sonneratiae TaxID=2816856 RepID=A0ABS3J502_9HYPH|nr:FAD-dependent monooxygenase [Jiella sonneratiae]MBO0904755.1 FAD-dependent monooxygenase [Jiella sonneratiae]
MTSPKMTPRIAIAGAGIAGLTAALCLSRLGIASSVLERSETLDEVGAGLQLSPNALSVLDELDLLPPLRAAGVAADLVELRSGRSGRTIAEVPVRSKDGTPYLSIHRADLQAVLVAAVKSDPKITLRLGAEVATVATVAGGLDIGLAAGETIGAALLVGADGVRSAVARRFGLAPAQPTGTTAWRTTVAADPKGPGPAGSGTGREAGTPPARITAWLGPRRHAVAYPVRAGTLRNLVLVTRSGDGPKDAAALLGGFALGGFAHWDPRLVRLIGAAAPPTPWPLFSAPAARPFVLGDGRVVLIGDAAHAMAPYAAQGAGMAIEDAAVLAAALATEASPAAAARRYEAARRPRIDRVRRRVGFHRLVYHLPPPFSLGRNAVLGLRPAEALRADLAWLYDWRSPKLRP